MSQLANPSLSEQERIFASRLERFLRLGFSEGDAELLAESNVDWHDAAKLLNRGCCLRLAFDILI